MERKRNSKRFFRIVGQSALYWTLALLSFAIFRFYGLDEEISILVDQNIIYKDFKIPSLIASIIGFLLGLLYGVVDYVYERKLLKKYSLGTGLLLKTFFHFVCTIMVFNLALGFFSFFFPLRVNLEIGWWLTDKGFWVVLPFEEVKNTPGLRLSPIGVVPQHAWRPRPIVDYTFYGINEVTQPNAPNEQKFWPISINPNPNYGGTCFSFDFDGIIFCRRKTINNLPSFRFQRIHCFQLRETIYRFYSRQHR